MVFEIYLSKRQSRPDILLIFQNLLVYTDWQQFKTRKVIITFIKSTIKLLISHNTFLPSQKSIQKRAVPTNASAHSEKNKKI